MLTTRQKLHEYIDVADDEEVEAIYADIKHSTSEPYQWWEDEELVAELERRSADLKSGKDKGIPWEEVKMGLLNRFQKK